MNKATGLGCVRSAHGLLAVRYAITGQPWNALLRSLVHISSSSVCTPGFSCTTAHAATETPTALSSTTLLRAHVARSAPPRTPRAAPRPRLPARRARRVARAVEQVDGGPAQRRVLVGDAGGEAGAARQRARGRHAPRPVLVHLHHQLPHARPAPSARAGRPLGPCERTAAWPGA